jgi:hypothetical protein
VAEVRRVSVYKAASNWQPEIPGTNWCKKYSPIHQLTINLYVGGKNGRELVHFVNIVSCTKRSHRKISCTFTYMNIYVYTVYTHTGVPGEKVNILGGNSIGNP